MHPYAALHAATQRRILEMAGIYGIEEVEARIWQKVDRLLKAQSPEEAQLIAERSYNAAQVAILLTWGKRKKRRDDAASESGVDCNT